MSMTRCQLHGRRVNKLNGTCVYWGMTFSLEKHNYGMVYVSTMCCLNSRNYVVQFNDR